MQEGNVGMICLWCARLNMVKFLVPHYNDKNWLSVERVGIMEGEESEQETAGVTG